MIKVDKNININNFLGSRNLDYLSDYQININNSYI